MVLDDERDHHWCMVFEDNNVGVYGKKALIHEKRWGVYNSENWDLVKGGYSVEVDDKYGKKEIW